MVYSKDWPEYRILDALARKSDVMQDTLQEQDLKGIVFPGKLTVEFEWIN